MSRIGLQPINVPAGVEITVDAANVVTVKGPKGVLSTPVGRSLTVAINDGVLAVSRPDNSRINRSQHGLARTLINNLIEGVTKGHEKSLQIIGVGYRAQLEGADLVLNVGYSHPVRIAAPSGIQFRVVADEKTRQQEIFVSGIDKVVVGQTAADIRKVRKPDAYKGKGIRYRGEIVKTKPGKRAGGKK